MSAAATLASPAQAATEFVDLTFEIGDWTFLPAADLDAQRTEAVLAVNNKGDLTGDNIAVVLYTRDDRDGWERFAWTNDDPAASIASGVKGTDPTADDATIEALLERAGIVLGPGESPGTLGTVDAEPFGKGVLEIDPYNSLLETGLAGNELVVYLVETGYRAAMVDIDVSELGAERQEIAVGEVLNALSKGTEYAVKHPSAKVAHVHAAVVAQAQTTTAAICFPFTTKGRVISSDWTCGSWTRTSDPPTWAVGMRGSYTWKFKFERTATRTQRRSYAKQCLNCNYYAGTQRRTETGIQTATASVTSNSNTTPPPTPLRPSPPATGDPRKCGPSDGTSTTAWSPAIPSC